MAKRSPLNKRYQKDAQVGSTRKSAAAAKVKKPGGTSSAKPKKASAWRRAASSGRGSSSAYSQTRPELPPELKSLQRFSLILLGVAFVLSAVYLWKAKSISSTWSSIILGFAYAIMFTALYIDFAKIRPWIKANRGGAKGASSGGSGRRAESAKLTTSGKTARAEKAEEPRTPDTNASDGDERT